MRFSPLPLQHPVQANRRLSFTRLSLAIVLLAVLCASSFYGVARWKVANYRSSNEPWFAGYVDVTATPTYAFEQAQSDEQKDTVLSFVVAKTNTGCTPAWGGAYTLDDASSSLDLDRRIARLRQTGGDVAVSFGGLKHNELAVTCTDQTALYNAYSSVINRYHFDMIDLDLENTGLTDKAADMRRAATIAKLQKDRLDNGQRLAVWVTLPVSPNGLTEAGTDAITQLLASKVDLAGVNIMTMDYGSSLPKGMSMAAAAESALTETHRQLGILYNQRGIYLNSNSLWSKLGATPMIGQNDTIDEIFSLKDAAALHSFAQSHHLGRMSMWSTNRDLACSDNYANTQVVSDSCSGVAQDKGAFAATLGAGYKGSITLSAGLQTKADKPDSTDQTADDPRTSPYQIWSITGTYLEGTKVVWHHNVYQAKWWTQGDSPDNPVLQSWQTPWQLVGPVLPGEKPVPQATLPAGTYPDWSGTDDYNTGDRVLFNGTPYQAKWWNNGSSPAAASSNPDSSPWVPLTQEQINDILTNQEN